MIRCKKCLLPAIVPGSEIDAGGTCIHCRTYSPERSQLSPIPGTRDDLERTLREAKGASSSGYDCVVPFSGGKDSAFLLHRLKSEYGLRVLALTSDINLPPAAWSTIRTTLARLQIDHVIQSTTQHFVRKLFRYLLSNQEARGAVYTVSYVYAPLFEGDAIRLAIEKDIPLVLAGYSPGQPEPERMRYEFAPKLISEEDWTPPHLKESGAFTDEELGRFYNPNRIAKSARFPRYLAPFHAWDYDQNAVIQKVIELGLVKRAVHANPIVSNYPVNWLMMYSDLKHFGYNPYTPEFSTLIREGKASLRQWKLLAPIVDFMIRRRVLLGREVTKSLRWLDLHEGDLRITQPRGAYDPPLLRQ